jgi:hypothetical protein
LVNDIDISSRTGLLSLLNREGVGLLAIIFVVKG